MTVDGPRNVWVTTQTAGGQFGTAPAVEPQPTPAPHVSGPQRPQPGGVTSAPGGLGVAPYAAPLTGGCWILGCHGGAGVSTVIQALPGVGTDASRVWPAPVDGVRAPVVLVARTHFTGLQAAQGAARQWASGSLPWVSLLGLVLVADAPGRPPKPLRDLQRLVSGGVPRTWYLPWVEPWRCGDPIESHVPRQVTALGRDLHQTLGELYGRP
ncbi:hypothetical protein SAMN05428942_7243 [Streptomyces sp. 2112.2]|nr:hypothetical protein SAMN05428942_7243 [Streptomyces sp. 2112.2]